MITSKMSGGEAVVIALEKLGVSHVFGIPSVHNLPIYDALGRRRSIEVIHSRHEQNAVHEADGYARSTGRLGVAITSTGPGASNAVPGLFEASFANSPVLMITGQIDTTYYGKGLGFLHEAEHQLPMLATVTRRAETVRRTEEIPRTLFSIANDIVTGRCQPGAVEIPIDQQYRVASIVWPEPLAAAPLVPDEGTIEKICDIVASSDRVLIWAGGGVVSPAGAQALRGLAEFLGVPVVTSPNGRGAIPETHPLCLGASSSTKEVEELVADAEVVLAIGTRFQSMATFNWDVRIPGCLIHIDADPGVIGRNYRAEVALVADATLSLEAILDGLHRRTGAARDRSGFLERAQAAVVAIRKSRRAEIGPDHELIMDTMRDALGERSPIVRDSTVPAYRWGDRLIPIIEPRTSMRPTSGAIGPGLPLGIGAAIGSGEPVVVIQGDGGLMLSVGELSTAVENDLPLILCVFNDRGYGVLRWIQDGMFNRRTAVDLSTPDFVALATAMGAVGESVVGAEQFGSAFSRALERRGPTVLDIDMIALAPMSIGTWGGRRR